MTSVDKVRDFAHFYDATPVEPVSKASTLLQRCAAFLAMAGAGASVCMVAYWASNKNVEEKYMGGLNWKELIFNWHPVLMVTGLLFCFVYALVSFRIFTFGKKINKLIHGTLHTGAVICFSVGLYAVFYGNNNPSVNDAETGYYSNLFSLHSFLGLTAISLYCQNYILGFTIFLFPGASSSVRRAYLDKHILFGILTLFAVTAAITTGIMELNTEFGCFYDVTKADTNPAANYHLLPEACRLSNALGIVVLLTTMCAAASVIDIAPPAASHVPSDAESRLLQ